MATDLSRYELHSRAELQYCCAVLAAWLHQEGINLTVNTVMGAVDAGNQFHLSDFCFADPGDTTKTIVVEYDENYWHKDRVQKDVDKSNVQLSDPSVAQLIRLRRGVVSIAVSVDNCRYTEIVTDSIDPVVQARATLQRLGVVPEQNSLQRGVELGTLAHVQFDEQRKVNFEMLKCTLGRRCAIHVIRSGGVQTRLWNAKWCTELLRFAELVGRPKLATALNGGVACKLTDSAWFEGLDRFAELVGRPKLATALSGGVACKLTDPAWFEGLERFVELVGRPKLATALSDGVACKLTDSAWFEGLDRFAELVGRPKLATALSGGVACKLTDPAWFEGLDRFAELVGRPKLATALSGSVACKLTDPAWFETAHALNQLLSPADFVRCCRKLASRLPAVLSYLRSICASIRPARIKTMSRVRVKTLNLLLQGLGDTGFATADHDDQCDKK